MMPDGGRNPKVDEFIGKAEKWGAEFAMLREIALGCGLVEEFKWGVPCYTFEKKNVVLIHGFKEYCAMLFVKGALLSDPQGILVRQTENVQAGRQARFTSAGEISGREDALKAYIAEAVEVEKSGREVAFRKSEAFTAPEELQNRFDEDPALKTAFEALTPGRQRAYILYFSQPKQSKTRESRIDKYTRQILSGKGLND